MNPFEHRQTHERLLVILQDPISDLIRKGEVTDRYYNPGDLFREVHILLLNDDRPDKARLQKMVGSAKVVMHNLASPSFSLTLGWHPALLKSWATPAMDLARKIQPRLIRCHGNRIDGYVASLLKQELGIPYVISMHINPDEDLRRFSNELTFKQKLYLAGSSALERISLTAADATICVYHFIVPYAQKFGAKRIEVIYNAINPTNLQPKTDYALSKPIRIAIVGRQFNHKDPTPLLCAIKELPDTTLTLVGDGPIHETLKATAKALGMESRCAFYRSQTNDELCRSLKNYDIFVSINDYGGVSKAELEAAHVGLPIITNAHPREDKPEVLGENCLVVDGNATSYRDSLKTLINDEALRARLGTNVRTSVARLAPAEMEARVVSIYRELTGSNS